MAAHVSRRATIAGTAGLPLLAACGGDGGAPSSTASTTSPASSAAPRPTRSRGPARSLTPAADVPVGGGRVLGDEDVVVTQPVQGEFRGFSATCTHQGCLVGSVDGGTINCPCHGSAFSIEDGSVVTGPATTPLPAVPVRVRDGQVVRS